MLNPTVYLANYQPPAFSIDSVHLEFDLEPTHAMVRNTLRLQRDYPGDLELAGEALELVSIELNGKLLAKTAYRVSETSLCISDCPNQFTLIIVTRIYPQTNTSLSGLYRSNQLFCTQCEAEGFRRITYFLDRPDCLSRFSTKITANKTDYPVLLSNGNLIDSGDCGDGKHWVLWVDPFKKPAYLFALVAGKLSCVADQYVTKRAKLCAIHIYVEPGQEDKCQHAIDSLKKAMRWDEDEFGLEYDLDLYMIVAVSDFNMGAMENKGLNIFNAQCVLARPDTATDNDYAGIESVVAHEYFHNWTGNRVTCRDWFQLSLKEGLTVYRDQEFSRDMNSRDLNRILDVSALRNSQFPEDAGPMAHAVRPESYQEINNFYTATIYDKGAEVIRMQRTLVGKEGFRRGMDLYFERHDGQAVTIDDFVAAMEEANQVDFSQFKRWYSQAGTPIVEVVWHYEACRLTLDFSQYCRPTAECAHKLPFHIPISMALFNAKGERIPLSSELLELKEYQQRFVIEDVPEKPLVSLLREFSAPINLKTPHTEDELIDLMRFETDGFAKWDAAQRLALNTIIHFYHTPATTWCFPTTLLAAYRDSLNHPTLDYALRAELLTPPSFSDVLASLTNADVDIIEAARDYFWDELSQGLLNEATKCYHVLWQQEDNARTGLAYSRRKLRNICLNMMMSADEKNALAICQVQFSQAQTMTDQLASFDLLVNSQQTIERTAAIDAFYQQWQHEPLVLDKWFSIQARCKLPNTLLNVEALLNHLAFDIKNPNKVRALVGGFSQGNPRHFHAINGQGYDFLMQMVLELDSINPQIAARLITPFTRGQNLDSTRQAMIKARLAQLAAAKLSVDLREMVTKSQN